jgi:hypothetical protein
MAFRSRLSTHLSATETDVGLELPAYSIEAASETETSNLTSDSDALSPSPANAPEPRPLAEHKFLLTDKKDKAWATLILKSRARSVDHMPTFLEGDPIEGSLLIDIGRKESIMSIQINVSLFPLPVRTLHLARLLQINGKIVARPQTGEHLAVSDSYVFLNETHVLWKKTSSDPRTPTPFPLSIEIRRGDLLSGQHSWPISFILPREVTLPPTFCEQMQIYKLPQTLLEKFTDVSIQYEIVLEFNRGFLRSTSR